MNKSNFGPSWLAALTVVALSAALIGCGDRQSVFFNPGQRVQGPLPVVKGETIEEVDLITELRGDPADPNKVQPDDDRAIVKS